MMTSDPFAESKTIKCGNCKDQHLTVADVRACHGKTSALPGITEKQLRFIRALSEERGVDTDDADLTKLSKAEASREISRLLSLPKIAQASSGSGRVVSVNDSKMPGQGVFTVVMTDGSRISIRVHKGQQGWSRGKLIISYLSGPQNTQDWTRCGYIDFETGGANLNKNYGDDTNLVKAIKVLLGANQEEREAMGYSYAMESSRCFNCNKLLTVPISVYNGLGPVCADNLGVMRNEVPYEDVVGD